MIMCAVRGVPGSTRAGTSGVPLEVPQAKRTAQGQGGGGRAIRPFDRRTRIEGSPLTVLGSSPQGAVDDSARIHVCLAQTVLEKTAVVGPVE